MTGEPFNFEIHQPYGVPDLENLQTLLTDMYKDGAVPLMYFKTHPILDSFKKQGVEFIGLVVVIKYNEIFKA